jgi:DNA-binding MarR family transcriptional regulator
VSKLVTRLLEKKLVDRRGSQGDRRFQEIELTRNGKALVPKLAELADQNDEEVFSRLSHRERKQLTDLLKKLAKIHQLKTVPTE